MYEMNWEEAVARARFGKYLTIVEDKVGEAVRDNPIRCIQRKTVLISISALGGGSCSRGTGSREASARADNRTARIRGRSA